MNIDASNPLPIEAEGFKVYYGVPLVAKGQVKGVLEVFLRTDRLIDQERLEFLEALAGQAAIAIDNSTCLSNYKIQTPRYPLPTMPRWKAGRKR